MSWLLPDSYISSVLAVDLDALKSEGITTIFLDLDNTILSRERTDLIPEYRTWCNGLLEQGFKVCIISNNHNGPVSRIAEELGFSYVANSLKPLFTGYMRALRKVGSRRHETVMIGDQLFTDILGANMVGMGSIMVLPLAKKDLKHTLMLRKVEKLFMKDRVVEY